MATSVLSAVLPTHNVSMLPEDKYRGAVVEVRTISSQMTSVLTGNLNLSATARISNCLQLSHSPPTNPSRAQSSLHTSVISLTYRNYAVSAFYTTPPTDWLSSRSVLDKLKRPLGYVDAAELKAKWQAGYAKPVPRPPLLRSPPHLLHPPLE